MALIPTKMIEDDAITADKALTATAIELTDSTTAEGNSTSLARANHSHAHGNRGGGSLHAAATTSTNGFMTAADKQKLDDMPGVSGWRWKEAARAVSEANVASLSGTTTIDDVALVADDRVLLTAQSDATENGIWLVQAGAWTRPTDFPTGGSAASVSLEVSEGTANADTEWRCTSDLGADVIDTNNLAFTQKSAGGGAVTAGAGLTLSGSTLDVVANADGSMVINANDIQVGILATDTQHGVRGGGTQHAVATTSVAGFLSGADKTKLDGVATGATATVERRQALTAENISTDSALADTLNFTPISGTVKLFFFGLLMVEGTDYSVSGTTINWLAASGDTPDLEVGDSLVAVYQSAA